MKKIIAIGIVGLMLISVFGMCLTVNAASEEKEESTSSIYKTDDPSLSDIDWWTSFRHDSSLSGFTTSDAPDTNNLKLSKRYIPNGFTCVKNFEPYIYDNKAYIYQDSVKIDPPNIEENRGFYCLDTTDGSTIWSKPGLHVSGIAVTNDRVYLTTINILNQAEMKCFDFKTGTEKWSYSWPASFTSASLCPVYYEGKFYLTWVDFNLMPLSVTVYVYCIKDDGNDATMVWNEKLVTYSGQGEYIIPLAPAVANGKVYVDTMNKVFCFNADNGNLLWGKDRSRYSNCILVTDGDRVYFDEFYFDGQVSKGYVTCLNALNGDEIWSKELMPSLDGFSMYPGVANGKVYVGVKTSFGNYVFCLDRNNGNQLWSKYLFHVTNMGVLSFPVVADNKVYIAGGKSDPNDPTDNWGAVYCLDATSGADQWNSTLDGPAYLLSIANGALYIPSMSGTLYKFEDKNQNNPPYRPSITGQKSGKSGVEYTYTASTTDLDGDQIYYQFDWGDGTITDWKGPFASGTGATESHTWSTKGTYTVKAKAKDIHGAESDWTTLTVTMPTSYSYPDGQNSQSQQQSASQSNPSYLPSQPISTQQSATSITTTTSSSASSQAASSSSADVSAKLH